MGKDPNSSVSPTVSQVIDQFILAMREDDGIENQSIDRLEEILRKDSVPKANEVSAALFDPSKDGEA